MGELFPEAPSKLAPSIIGPGEGVSVPGPVPALLNTHLQWRWSFFVWGSLLELLGEVRSPAEPARPLPTSLMKCSAK